MNRFLQLNKPIVLVLLMACLAGPFLWILKPFWLTIILGLVFAISLAPFLGWLERRMKTTSHWALVLLLVGLTTIIIVPFGLVLIKGTQALWLYLQYLTSQESLDMFKSYQINFVSHLEILKNYGLDPISFQDSLWSASQKAGEILTSRLGDTLTRIPESILLFFVLVLSIVSFLMMRRPALAITQELTWLSPEGRDRLISKFLGCCRSVVASTIVTGALQATLTGIGAAIFTSHNALLVFFITFVLSFVPIVGASPVSLVLAVIAFVNGHIGNGIGLLVFFSIISITDNILRPWLLSGSTRMPPIWALFCTVGAVFTFGLPGLFIGPLIGALTLELIPILAEEYQRKGE